MFLESSIFSWSPFPLVHWSFDRMFIFIPVVFFVEWIRAWCEIVEGNLIVICREGISWISNWTHAWGGYRLEKKHWSYVYDLQRVYNRWCLENKKNYLNNYSIKGSRVNMQARGLKLSKTFSTPAIYCIGVKLNSRCFSMKTEKLFIVYGTWYFIQSIVLQKLRPFSTFHAKNASRNP